MKRRVSFKPSGRNGKGGRISDIAIRAHFEDDEDMGGGTNDTRNKEGGSRNNVSSLIDFYKNFDYFFFNFFL